MNDIPDWLWQGLSVWVAGKCAEWAWNERETFIDWYYIARHQLTKPFKPYNNKATLTVEVVGVIKKNPYSGEYETIYFK